jgi:hypothetical protein
VPQLLFFFDCKEDLEIAGLKIKFFEKSVKNDSSNLRSDELLNPR